MNILKPTDEYGWPHVEVDGAKIVDLTRRMAGVKYRLGAKAHPLSTDPDHFVGIDQTGSTGHFVDCSGFTRYVLNLCGILLPDGSVNQREWVEANKFKPSTPQDAGNKDGAVRIAFLSPEDTHEHIGHVVLLPGDGLTCESHGGFGVDRRVWGSQLWMRNTHCFVLCPPK